MKLAKKITTAAALAAALLAAQHKAAEIGALDLFRQMYTA